MKFKDLKNGQRVQLLTSLHMLNAENAKEDVKYKYVTREEMEAMFYEAFASGTMFELNVEDSILESVPDEGQIGIELEDEIDPKVYFVHPEQNG